MRTVGLDLDGVISLLPFHFRQANLTQRNEKIIWRLSEYKVLLKLYNKLFRRVNHEVQEAMRYLKDHGNRIVIISAEFEKCRDELEEWLDYNGFWFDELFLKPTLIESQLPFKERLASSNCKIYFDDMKKIVDHINVGHNGCSAIHYNGQTKEELLKIFFQHSII